MKKKNYLILDLCFVGCELISIFWVPDRVRFLRNVGENNVTKVTCCLCCSPWLSHSPGRSHDAAVAAPCCPTVQGTEPIELGVADNWPGLFGMRSLWLSTTPWQNFLWRTGVHCSGEILKPHPLSWQLITTVPTHHYKSGGICEANIIKTSMWIYVLLWPEEVPYGLVQGELQTQQ